MSNIETSGEYVLGDDLEGDYVLGDELDGDYVVGDDIQLVGARRRRRGARPRRRIRRPKWRNTLAAPGVQLPGEGLQPLPLVPSLNAGVFNAATPNISFTARPQAPFRPERLLATVRRSGATGVIILANYIFVGRQMQMVQLGSFDIENFSPTAFGVRLQLDQAEPGVEIRIDCSANPAVGGADTVAVALLFLGRTIA